MSALELRPYQLDAIAAIEREHQHNRSTLLVMATGTGKTATFAEVIKRTSHKCLVLAHRDELIQQAKHRIEESVGERCEVEKADERAMAARIVVGSIQTMMREHRLRHFRRDEFGLVVADEAHHSCAPSHQRVLDYFESTKVLGVTATPDRSDRKALGQVFDSVAYVYDIADAIRDGWLVPLSARTVMVESVDLTQVGTVAGDFHQRELDDAMKTEKALHGVARPLVIGLDDGSGPLAGDRRTIVFTTSIDSSNRLAEVMNRYRNGCAQSVHSDMPIDERRALLRSFSRGDFQFIVNVGVLAEGYDHPEVSCIAMARPTKSRIVAAQQVGRGTRLASGKRECMILDFVGIVGRHKLVTPHDILGGEYDDEMVELAKKLSTENPDMQVLASLELARGQLAAMRQAALAEKAALALRREQIKATRVLAKMARVDPFNVFGVLRPPADKWADQFGVKMPTDKQIAFLAKSGLPLPEGATRAQASAIIEEVIRRRNDGMSSYNQVKLLKRNGYVDAKDLTFARASELIDRLSARWNHSKRAAR